MPHTRPDSARRIRTRSATAVLALLLGTGAAAAHPAPAAAPVAAPTLAPGPTPATSDAPRQAPRLVVMVAVDQLRADMIHAYAELYRHGFRRLLDQGRTFTRASHAHAHTETAAGHASLATGVFPSKHGIVANNWDEQTSRGWRSVYAVEDTLSHVVGIESWDGRSPRNMARGGLADWIREADPEARVLSLSTKDRAAITMSGRTRDHTYWIATPGGRFVTSTWYRDGYPDWVERFNREVMEPLYSDSVWSSRIPEGQERWSRPDPHPAEGDGVHTTFPHRASQETRDTTTASRHYWIRGTPTPDQATVELALRGVDELDMGRRGGPGPDYLAISFSQVDYVGHGYGPFSREQLDNLLRLDRVLGRLMDGLDQRVGEGRWVLALSSDHGVLEMPEFRVEQGLPGLRLSAERVRGLVSDIQAWMGEGGSLPEIRERVMTRAEELPFVARVYRQEDHLRGEPADSFAVLYRNSYYPGRRAGLLSRLGLDIRLTEGTLGSGRAHGTTHGSPYWYDRHVPLVFVGAGVEPGRSDEPAYTVDVAPTLARLAGVDTPDDLDGRVLEVR